MSDIFEKSLPAHLSREEFLQDYETLLSRYGKSDTRIAELFHDAGVAGFQMFDTPRAILNRDRSDTPAYPLKAAVVSEYLKKRPAIMMVKNIDGKINTFLPFQLAGILCLVHNATGEEPVVDDFPVRDGADIEFCSKYAYLWCYGEKAYESLKEGGATK